MRKRLGIAFLLFCSLATPPLAASVPPLTREGRILMASRQKLENTVEARFGGDMAHRLRDWNSTYGSIILGTEGKASAPRLLIKDEYGWYEVRPGSTRRLPQPVGHELNRLMHQEALWLENHSSIARPCRSGAQLFILRHAGKEQFGRQPCGASGLAGRVVEVASKLRVPPGPGRSTAALPPEDRSVGAPPGYQDFTRHMFHRLSDMAASWERKMLAGYVDPYAEDVIVERPEGVLRGRKAVVDWARREQDWSTRGLGNRLSLHQASFPPVQGDSFYSTHELRWEENGRPLRRTFSTLWRNNGGLWQIVHERVSEAKPVTEERNQRPSPGR